MSKLQQKKERKVECILHIFIFFFLNSDFKCSVIFTIVIFMPRKTHMFLFYFFPHNLHWRIGSDHSYHQQTDTYKAHTSILIPFFKRNDFYFFFFFDTIKTAIDAQLQVGQKKYPSKQQINLYLTVFFSLFFLILNKKVNYLIFCAQPHRTARQN